jgi:hypothetical protein
MVLAIFFFLFLFSNTGEAQSIFNFEIRTDNNGTLILEASQPKLDERCAFSFALGYRRNAIKYKLISTPARDIAYYAVAKLSSLPSLTSRNAGAVQVTGRNLKRRVYTQGTAVCGTERFLSKIKTFQVNSSKRGIEETKWVRELRRRLKEFRINTEELPSVQFDSPIDIQNDKGFSDALYIAEQGGKIWKLTNYSTSLPQNELFYDISSLTEKEGEKGLLGLSFHPDYKNNKKFYVNYTTKDSGSTVIAEFIADQLISTEKKLIIQDQPYANHNGGALAFDSEGHLLIALGDGGSAGDPQENGQKRTTFLGKILRINVNTAEAGKSYSIPASNPFINAQDGTLPEIFALGFRNPWKLSVDSETGAIWAGDVGQNRIEEIDRVEAGKNYGWNILEGSACYNTAACNKTAYAAPQTEYTRDIGQSVTGGYVYRGKNLLPLQGVYIFGDFMTGTLLALTRANKSSLILKRGFTLSTFGVDFKNEMYLADYGNGKIFQLTNR